jgi:hypothetical protein
MRPNLVGLGLIQPELFTADAHADAGVTEDHGTANPSATREDGRRTRRPKAPWQRAGGTR